jgi:hypothetical protein
MKDIRAGGGNPKWPTIKPFLPSDFLGKILNQPNQLSDFFFHFLAALFSVIFHDGRLLHALPLPAISKEFGNFIYFIFIYLLFKFAPERSALRSLAILMRH